MLPEKFNPNDLLIFGGGGHAKSIIDLIRTINQAEIAGIVDDTLPLGSLVMGVPILGNSQHLDELRDRGLRYAINTVGGIGKPDVRVKVFERLDQAGFQFPTLIHPRAFVETSAKLAEGNQILPMAYVGSESSIGFGCIINYGAIISHDCVLGDYVNLSPGATLAGGVQIGERSQIGMRATINLDLSIGMNVRIGNGATIKKDVPDGETVRAGAIWPAPL